MSVLLFCVSLFFCTPIWQNLYFFSYPTKRDQVTWKDIWKVSPSMLEPRVRPKQLLSSFFSVGPFQYSHLPQNEKCLQGTWHPGPQQLNNLNFPQPHSYVLLFKLLQSSHWSSQSEVWWCIQEEMGVRRKKINHSLFHGGLFPPLSSLQFLSLMELIVAPLFESLWHF